MTDSEILTLDEIRTLALDALMKSGATAENAEPLARATAETEAEGIASHGLAYIPIYCEHLTCGKVDGQAVPTIELAKPGLVLADAATGFAHRAIEEGFFELKKAAGAQGVAALAVRNSYNCGVLGIHTRALAKTGFLALGFTNAPASIAPSGGKAPVVGTNPISLAAPDGKGGIAFLIDQSASTIAKSEIMKYAREGKTIPEGWALDANGDPTTDPEAALKGSMAPSGGYKGAGMAIIVETMAAAAAGATLGADASPFSGTKGGPPRTGQFFLAIDAATSSGGMFSENILRLSELIREQPGSRLPGDGRAAARERALREGVTVSKATLDKIRQL